MRIVVGAEASVAVPVDSVLIAWRWCAEDDPKMRKISYKTRLY